MLPSDARFSVRMIDPGESGRMTRMEVTLTIPSIGYRNVARGALTTHIGDRARSAGAKALDQDRADLEGILREQFAWHMNPSSHPMYRATGQNNW